MTNVIDKLNKMYKFMSQHKFAVISDIIDDYKCGICKSILINAHHAICGCNFCYECINKYIANGAIDCPNNGEKFELKSLSNIAPNHRMNKLISNLIMRCSNKMCSHECKLIEMENHFSSCSNKTEKCQSNDIGCEHGDMINDKLSDPMLSDIRNHNKILIDLIENLRNEMRELKEKVEGNRLEIEILKENDRVKNEIIKSLKEEIKSIKQENEDLTQQMDIDDHNSCNKLDEIKNKCKKEELLKEFDEKFDMKMNARYFVMKEELNKKIKKMRERNEKSDIEISNKIDKIDKYLNLRDDGMLFWQIGKIDEIKWIQSERFYDKQNPYKMYLRLRNINNELNIWLRVHSSAFDDDLKWPVLADITIYIYALNDENIFKTVKKSSTIERPTNYSSKCGDPIKITQSDWTKSNLNDINCLLFCRVKFK